MPGSTLSKTFVSLLLASSAAALPPWAVRAGSKPVGPAAVVASIQSAKASAASSILSVASVASASASAAAAASSSASTFRSGSGVAAAGVSSSPSSSFSSSRAPQDLGDGPSITYTDGNSPISQTRPNSGPTLQEQAKKVPQGIFSADDGSIILDTTVTVNGLDLRFRASGPADAFTRLSGVSGGTAMPGDTSKYGINVLLHGDGGQTFWDFPNQNLRGNLMGVVVLAPEANLAWGGGSGVSRVNGEQHAKALNDFLQNELPKYLAYDRSKTYFTGVSGGSLMLSGFFIPDYMKNYVGSGVLLACGAMLPHVNLQDEGNVLRNTRIHIQSTQNELALIQQTLPFAAQIYEKTAKNSGMTLDQISKLQTINNSPNGGHCAFDGKGYQSGIQLLMDNYANIMFPGGSGSIPGIGNVLKPIVGNEVVRWGKPGAVA